LLIGAARRLLRLNGRLAGGAAGRGERSWRFPDNSRFHGLNGNLNSRFGATGIVVNQLIYWRESDRCGAFWRRFPVISRFNGNFGRRPALREFARSPRCAASPGQRGALEADAAVFVDYPEKPQPARPGWIAAIARAARPIDREPWIIAGRRSDVGRRRLQHQRPLRRHCARCRRRPLRLGRQPARAKDQRRGDGRPGSSHRRGAGVKAPSASSRRWRRRIVRAARRSAP
jgi:hypothetical protein